MLTGALRGYRSHYRSVLVLAVPLIGSNLAQSMKHLTDAVMLGWYGVEPLAAGVLGATVFTFIFIVGNGFSAATIPLVSGAEGERKSWKVRRFIRMGCWLTIIYGLMTLPLVVLAEHLFLILGQEPQISRLASDYLAFAIWGLFPALLLTVFKAFFLALVRPQVIFWSTVIGALFNVLGNYALIFGHWGMPELGVTGAAVSSTLSHSLSLVIMLLYLERTRDFQPYGLLQNLFRRHAASMHEIFHLGWPICMTLVAEALFFSSAAIMMGWISVVSLAAHGIVIEICAFVFMVYLGFANAGTSVIGSRAGKADYHGLKRAMVAILHLTFVAVMVTIAVFLLLPETIVSLFLKEPTPQSVEVLEIGVTLLSLAAIFQLFDALQVVLAGLLRGLKDTKIPMIYSGIGYCLVGLPSSYVLAFVFNLAAAGIYLGFVIGLSFASILFAARLFRKIKSLPSDS